MQKLFEVKAWHDYHGDPLFFLVVDAAGKKCARFASEVEAEKFVAMKEEQNQAELAVNLVALLPTRAWNALYNVGIRTVGDPCTKTEAELRHKIPGFGAQSLKKRKRHLRSLGGLYAAEVQ